MKSGEFPEARTQSPPVFVSLTFRPAAPNMGLVITRFIAINPECLEPEKYGRVIVTLKEGGVVVYPTDTFYGLGADCFSAPAIRRIYALKKRNPAKPLPVVVSDRDMAERAAREIPPLFPELATRFWPGPLTLILKAGSSLPRELLGEGDSIAVRLPDVLWLRAFVRQAGFPLVATSANLSGEKEISSAEDALALFNGVADIILDGGSTAGGKPSTVVDLTGAKPRLVREGALPSAKLGKYL